MAFLVMSDAERERLLSLSANFKSRYSKENIIKSILTLSPVDIAEINSDKKIYNFDELISMGIYTPDPIRKRLIKLVNLSIIEKRNLKLYLESEGIAVPEFLKGKNAVIIYNFTEDFEENISVEFTTRAPKITYQSKSEKFLPPKNFIEENIISDLNASESKIVLPRDRKMISLLAPASFDLSYNQIEDNNGLKSSVQNVFGICNSVDFTIGEILFRLTVEYFKDKGIERLFGEHSDSVICSFSMAQILSAWSLTDSGVNRRSVSESIIRFIFSTYTFDSDCKLSFDSTLDETDTVTKSFKYIEDFSFYSSRGKNREAVSFSDLDINNSLSPLAKLESRFSEILPFTYISIQWSSRLISHILSTDVKSLNVTPLSARYSRTFLYHILTSITTEFMKKKSSSDCAEIETDVESLVLRYLNCPSHLAQDHCADICSEIIRFSGKGIYQSVHDIDLEGVKVKLILKTQFRREYESIRSSKLIIKFNRREVIEAAGAKYRDGKSNQLKIFNPLQPMAKEASKINALISESRSRRLSSLSVDLSKKCSVKFEAKKYFTVSAGGKTHFITAYIDFSELMSIEKQVSSELEVSISSLDMFFSECIEKKLEKSISGEVISAMSEKYGFTANAIACHCFKRNLSGESEIGEFFDSVLQK